MNYLYVGVDVSKDSLDIVVVDHTQSKINSHFIVPNNLVGIDQLFKHLSEDCVEKNLWFCFEHTGNYQLLLAH